MKDNRASEVPASVARKNREMFERSAERVQERLHQVWNGDKK